MHLATVTSNLSNACGQALCSRVIGRMAWHINTGVPALSPPKQSSPRHLMGMRGGMYAGVGEGAMGCKEGIGSGQEDRVPVRGRPSTGESKVVQVSGGVEDT